MTIDRARGARQRHRQGRHRPSRSRHRATACLPWTGAARLVLLGPGRRHSRRRHEHASRSRRMLVELGPFTSGGGAALEPRRLSACLPDVSCTHGRRSRRASFACRTTADSLAACSWNRPTIRTLARRPSISVWTRPGLARLPDPRLGRLGGRSQRSRTRRRPTSRTSTSTRRSRARSRRTAGRLIRGGAAHFPALLEPILAAPLWAFGSTETAYRLVQVENSLFMSLAAIPSTCSLDASGSGTAMRSPVRHSRSRSPTSASRRSSSPTRSPTPRARALYAGVDRAAGPGRGVPGRVRRLAGARQRSPGSNTSCSRLRSWSRRIVLDGRAPRASTGSRLRCSGPRRSAWSALGPGRVLGYYSAVGNLQPRTGRSSAGPGSTSSSSLSPPASSSCPARSRASPVARGRAERRSPRSSSRSRSPSWSRQRSMHRTASDRFKERYLFVLLPLLPIAFGSVREAEPPAAGCSSRCSQQGSAAAARPCRSPAYTAGDGADDSPLLWAYRSSRVARSGRASLIFALAATAGALLAAAVAWMRLGASRSWSRSARWPRCRSARASTTAPTPARSARSLVAPDPAWVDACASRPGLRDRDGVRSPEQLLEQMFWNRSIDHELLLGANATPTDAFATRKLTVSGDGGCSWRAGRCAGPPLPGLRRDTRVRECRPRRSLLLVLPLAPERRRPRLSVLEARPLLGRLACARRHARALAGRGGRGTVSFTLSLPRSHRRPGERPLRRPTSSGSSPGRG